MSFDDKRKQFENVFKTDLNNKVSADINKSVHTTNNRRIPRSYTLRPDVIEAIDEAASKGPYSSASNLVEQTMIEKLHLHI